MVSVSLIEFASCALHTLFTLNYLNWFYLFVDRMAAHEQ